MSRVLARKRGGVRHISQKECHKAYLCRTHGSKNMSCKRKVNHVFTEWGVKHFTWRMGVKYLVRRRM